jgi:hypothetical protein
MHYSELTLKKKLSDFRKKYKVLFPLLQPISLTIFYTPPKHNTLDSDNLARYVIPLVAEIFQPPPTLKMDFEYISNTFKPNFVQRLPKNSIASYQLIQMPRTNSTVDEGIINFYITDGLFSNNNIWWSIETFIDKWEDDVLR